MSEVEDYGEVAQQVENPRVIQAKVHPEKSYSLDEPRVAPVYRKEKFSKEESPEKEEDVRERQEAERCEDKKRSEWEKEEALKSAFDEAPTGSDIDTDTAKITTPASPWQTPPQLPSPPATPSPPTSSLPPTTTATPIETKAKDEGRNRSIETNNTEQSRVERRDSENSGEWNSLPVLVERLRAALELSLAAGSRRDDGVGAGTAALTEDSGIDSEEDQRIRNSMEQAVLGCKDPELKKDLKFLEDLLVSDIRTALSRLRETLERIDVTALAKHGTGSDPSSKLHLLRLVSSLISRLQVPTVTETVEDRSNFVSEVKSAAPSNVDPSIPIVPVRKRRATRHTIGVSAEELAKARKWLEEERSAYYFAQAQPPPTSNETIVSPVISLAHNETTVNGLERRQEEVRDKYTKDVINQRQSLRDKWKEPRREINNIRGEVIPSVYAENTSVIAQLPEPTVVHQTDANRARRASNSSSSVQRGTRSNEDEIVANGIVEDPGRVSKLVAALRQRGGDSSLNTGKCAIGGNNKFNAKKLKIKRANTIDIPSYLKLQAESLAQDGSGCVSLRRPINVSDRNTCNPVNIVGVPSFQPKTDNDRKFLALINKNVEAPSLNVGPVFKSFGHPKTTDVSALTNENWNSRFSNIKTAFDKPSPKAEVENKVSPRINTWNDSKAPWSESKAPWNESKAPWNESKAMPKRAPGVVPRVAHRFGPTTPTNASTNPFGEKSSAEPGFRNGSSTMNHKDGNSENHGFRHALSSPFRKIEKPAPVYGTSKQAPPTYHWPRKNSQPGNGLLEKARNLFDRENENNYPNILPNRANEPVHGDPMNSDRPAFVRPPWIEQEPCDTRPNAPVPKHGRIDYRNFCKQFAPFVGKGGTSSLLDSKKKPRGPGTYGRQEENRESVRGKNSGGVVEGKISFETVSEKRELNGPHEENTRRVEAEPRNIRASACPITTGKSSFPRSPHVPEISDEDYSRATLRGSASVAVQTGHEEEAPCDVRSFRVGPKLSKNPALICNNASVQTPRNENLSYDEPVQPLDRQETIECHDDELRRMNLPCSINNNFSNVVPCDYPRPDYERLQKDSRYQGTPTSRSTMENSIEEFENPTCPGTDLFPCFEDRDQNPSYYADRDSSTWNNPDRVNNNFLNEENIQNQDISPEVGVVTRYTCAIATVASVGSPEGRSEEGIETSRESSTPSPSRSSSSWSRPRPTSETRVLTPEEEEIRRHNILQQSLMRRLQNTSDAILDHQPEYVPPVVKDVQQPEYLPPLKDIHQQEYRPSVEDVHQPEYRPPVKDIRQPEYRPPIKDIRQPEYPPHVKDPQQEDYRSPVIKDVHQSAKFLAPPDVSKRTERSLSPIGLAIPSNSISNRVTTLREAYEQPNSAPSKPIRKERSPVANGGNPIDSSDEYLVSCANKPSRSIVLSKSESWHQLALSSAGTTLAPHRQSHASRTGDHIVENSGSQLSASPRASGLLKPPKPRSPSSLKLRSKQYEASSSSDSVKKMEDKIRRYFGNSFTSTSTFETSKEMTRGRRSSAQHPTKGMLGLSRSQTMPGISENSTLRLTIPQPTSQMPISNLSSLNSAEVDKVFDDLFEEATKSEQPRKKPISPFAKFRQLDRQHSASSLPSSLKSPGADFRFKFTEPTVRDNAAQIKERLLAWCRSKTKEYTNVQLDNFSTSWNNGLAFCALIHHFRPDAFDYDSLRPENRRHNFTLAFAKADEVAGIAPLLDVEDMVSMRRPDWKCVFTYVQSIYRRFKDED